MCSLVKPSISAALPRFRTEITLLTHSVSKHKSATGGKPQYVAGVLGLKYYTLSRVTLPFPYCYTKNN